MGAFQGDTFEFKSFFDQFVTLQILGRGPSIYYITILVLTIVVGLICGTPALCTLEAVLSRVSDELLLLLLQGFRQLG
jgi:hypothetical protein